MTSSGSARHGGREDQGERGPKDLRRWTDIGWQEPRIGSGFEHNIQLIVKQEPRQQITVLAKSPGLAKNVKSSQVIMRLAYKLSSTTKSNSKSGDLGIEQ